MSICSIMISIITLVVMAFVSPVAVRFWEHRRKIEEGVYEIKITLSLDNDYRLRIFDKIKNEKIVDKEFNTKKEAQKMARKYGYKF